MTDQLRDWADLLARVLLAHMFIISGWHKIGGFTDAQAYIASQGVWPWLLPLVILVELGGGVLLVAGYRTRIMAFLLGGFTALAALLFHSDFGAPGQAISFMKNFAIAGGMLVVVLNGPGRFSFDRLRSNTGVATTG